MMQPAGFSSANARRLQSSRTRGFKMAKCVIDWHGGLRKPVNWPLDQAWGASFQSVTRPREAVGSDVGRGYFHINADADDLLANVGDILLFHRPEQPHAL